MRIQNFFFVLLLNFWSKKADAVKCDSIVDFLGYDWCKMDGTAAINADDVHVSQERNENIRRLMFTGNRKISFLPIETYEKLPNLLWIDAASCSLSSIGKKNFNQLNKLMYLDLSGNKIEKITSDTFDHLVDLRIVYLNSNKIKFMNGKLFERKPNLVIIGLLQNVCINKHASWYQEIQNLLPDITAQCGFVEEPVGESNLLGINCGRDSYSSGLIEGGNKTVRGKWPFIAALILASNGQYFCGGNLISSKHVLTAAHCLHEKHQITQLKAEEVDVLLGRHNLKVRERGSERGEVAKIILHPKWKSDMEKYDSDLAILVLERKVLFSDFIQPVCLTKDIAIMDQVDGTVVGWGKSESEAAHENIPREVAIRAVTTEVCFDKDHNLGNIYSPTAFCAGGEGAGPCTGDSGGGFIVHFQGFWTLRGIVSAGTMKSGIGCDVNRYNLFTKLIEFSNWIKKTVKQN